MFVNDPNFIFYNYEFWRFVTCPYICIQLFQLLITGCMYLPRAHEKEHGFGTARYAIYFLLNNFIGQALFAGLSILLFNIIQFPIYSVGPGSGMMHNGLWVMIMMEMTTHGLRNPDASSYFCFCPCEIKAKWMPWLFMILISLFTLKPALDILSGIVLGYVHMKTKLLNWTVASDGFAQRVEGWCFFTWMKVFGCYVTVAETTTGIDETSSESTSY
jgi:hypothetical protein